MHPPRILTAARVGSLAVLIANGFAQAAASLALVAIVGAAVSGGQPVDRGWLIVVASLSLGISLFALRVMQRRQGAAFALNYVREVRGKLVEQLFALPPTAGRVRLGLVMTRLITDLSAIRSWLADGVASLFVAGPCVVLTSLGAFWLTPEAAPFLLAGIVVWFAVTLVALPFLHRAIRESRRRRGRLAGRLGEVVLARATFAHFGRSGPATRKIDRMSEALNEWLVRRAGWSGAVRASSDFVMPVIIAILAAFAFSGSPAMPAGDLSTLLLLAGLTVGQLSDLARAADYRLAYLESHRRIASILAMPALADPENPIPLPRSAGRRLHIEFHDTIGRPSRVLKAAPGSLILLRGDSQEIRNALFSCLAGFEESSGIAIFLDDIPFHRTSRRDRRRAVTLLSPMIPLVRGTMAENVAIGAPSATPQEKIAAIASVCGASVDETWETGRMRPEPPHGVSSVEAARIRAARALIRSAAVLLIDDVEVCRDKELLGAVVAHARAMRTTVIVSCEVDAATTEFDDTWLL